MGRGLREPVDGVFEAGEFVFQLFVLRHVLFEDILGRVLDEIFI